MKTNLSLTMNAETSPSVFLFVQHYKELEFTKTNVI